MEKQIGAVITTASGRRTTNGKGEVVDETTFQPNPKENMSIKSRLTASGEGPTVNQNPRKVERQGSWSGCRAVMAVVGGRQVVKRAEEDHRVYLFHQWRFLGTIETFEGRDWGLSIQVCL